MAGKRALARKSESKSKRAKHVDDGQLDGPHPATDQEITEPADLPATIAEGDDHDELDSQTAGNIPPTMQSDIDVPAEPTARTIADLFETLNNTASDEIRDFVPPAYILPPISDLEHWNPSVNTTMANPSADLLGSFQGNNRNVPRLGSPIHFERDIDDSTPDHNVVPANTPNSLLSTIRVDNIDRNAFALASESNFSRANSPDENVPPPGHIPEVSYGVGPGAALSGVENAHPRLRPVVTGSAGEFSQPELLDHFRRAVSLNIVHSIMNISADDSNTVAGHQAPGPRRLHNYPTIAEYQWALRAAGNNSLSSSAGGVTGSSTSEPLHLIPTWWNYRIRGGPQQHDAVHRPQLPRFTFRRVPGTEMRTWLMHMMAYMREGREVDIANFEGFYAKIRRQR